jgi:2-succinyl-6-hydroxy-2,4-cyclohexadiene-1-carboxylate synthase
VPLHVEQRGSGSGPPVVLLHGFTQTARLWGPFGDDLAADHTLIGIDLPGHGGSDTVRADLPTAAGLVREAVISAIGADPCDLLGYSLGARVALHVVTATDLDVGHLMLVGGTGGIEDPVGRERRRQADEATAAALEESGDVESFIARWVRSPMFARLAGAAQPEERLRNTAAGLASSLRLAGTGTQEPLWDRLPSLAVPLLALAGTDDNRFAAHALRLAHAVPSGVASLIPGGGHAAHLAQPSLVARTVRHWLATTR